MSDNAADPPGEGDDPVCTDPDKYRTLFENDQVRVLEYRDRPGALTQPHRHPDSVMVTLSGFDRLLHVDGATRQVAMGPGQAHWLPAQVHQGENVGTTDTHVVFVELKGGARVATGSGPIGPVSP
ncbi:MAG: cytoplasmic protein [Acidimicrobiia bacterium]